MKLKVQKSKGAITAPRGFAASALSAGIKTSKKMDLALLFSEKKARAAAVFTTNKVKAWPVLIDQKHLTYPYHHAVFINSGNANCFNGPQNNDKAICLCKAFGKQLGLEPHTLFTASTGIIGRDFPAQKIMKAIPSLVQKLSRQNGHAAAKAILTTDTCTKEAKVSFMIKGKKVTLAAMGKGAGMMHPNMATMLVFLTSDINITKSLLQKALTGATKKTFNRITIDNDMSTNDTVLMLANGMSDNAIINKKGTEYGLFCTALEELCACIAKELVKDGEGVTKICDIVITGAKNEKHALQAARAIANSMLFKTALHGADPNWGRIVAAVGAVPGLQCSFEKMSIAFDGVRLMSHGRVHAKNTARAAKVMKKKEVILTVDLGVGKAKANIITSDLTKKYIHINAEYTT